MSNKLKNNENMSNLDKNLRKTLEFLFIYYMKRIFLGFNYSN
jgi:hypothetical protein